MLKAYFTLNIALHALDELEQEPICKQKIKQQTKALIQSLEKTVDPAIRAAYDVDEETTKYHLAHLEQLFKLCADLKLEDVPIVVDAIKRYSTDAQKQEQA